MAYDPNIKRLEASVGESRVAEAEVSKTVEFMLIVFFGIVQIEFLPQGQSINQHVYNEIL